MRIKLILEVEDDTDIDLSRKSGLTQEAEDRLHEALPDQGFLIVSGPEAVAE